MGSDRASVYIDSNVFLNAILYSPEKNQEAAQAISFLKKILNNEFDAHTSWLTWDEVVYILRREMGNQIAHQKGKEFLTYPHLNFENVTAEIIRDAQSIVEKYNLRPRDAIHLATAYKRKISEIITFDNDFKGVSEIQYHPPNEF